MDHGFTPDLAVGVGGQRDYTEMQRSLVCYGADLA
jgi:hypothetical protein